MTDLMPAILYPKSSQHVTAGPYAPVIGVSRDADIFVISGQAPVNTAGEVVGETLGSVDKVSMPQSY